MPEEPWPPAACSTLHPYWAHATRQLRDRDPAAHERLRCTPLPQLPQLPIPLSAEPCLSMLLHPGRVRTSMLEVPVRVGVVSMLVVDQLPSQLQLQLRLEPWGADGAGGGGGASSGVLTLTLSRDEFVQEGPSGPIECKKVVTLPVTPLQRTGVRFSLDSRVAARIGFCDTAPLMLEHVPQAADEQFV